MLLSTAIVARTVIAPAAIALGMTLLAGNASAVSFRVKLACASDYYSYCSQHSPDTPGVRQCMRVNGPKLSKSCINALIGAGEVAKSEVDRRRAAKQTAAR
ncbi:MAG: hypothetical protein ACKVP4_10285 [Hyphomicrobium sp.]